MFCEDEHRQGFAGQNLALFFPVYHNSRFLPAGTDRHRQNNCRTSPPLLFFFAALLGFPHDRDRLVSVRDQRGPPLPFPLLLSRCRRTDSLTTPSFRPPDSECVKRIDTPLPSLFLPYRIRTSPLASAGALQFCAGCPGPGVRGRHRTFFPFSFPALGPRLLDVDVVRGDAQKRVLDHGKSLAVFFLPSFFWDRRLASCLPRRSRDHGGTGGRTPPLFFSFSARSSAGE